MTSSVAGVASCTAIPSLVVCVNSCEDFKVHVQQWCKHRRQLSDWGHQLSIMSLRWWTYAHTLSGQQATGSTALSPWLPEPPSTIHHMPVLSSPAAREQTHPLKLTRTGIGSGRDMIALSAQEGREEARTSRGHAHATSRLAWETLSCNLPELNQIINCPTRSLAMGSSLFALIESGSGAGLACDQC